jgi:hypothetical protein
VPQQINYDEIIDRLTEKTDAGKVKWQQVVSLNKFTCTVDGEFTFKIERVQGIMEGGDFVRLSMTDKEDNEIFQVEQDTSYPLGRKLSGLHEAARRSALNVESKINAVKNILERM